MANPALEHLGGVLAGVGLLFLAGLLCSPTAISHLIVAWLPPPGRPGTWRKISIAWWVAAGLFALGGLLMVPGADRMLAPFLPLFPLITTGMGALAFATGAQAEKAAPKPGVSRVLTVGNRIAPGVLLLGALALLAWAASS